jgi:hypothetical protein
MGLRVMGAEGVAGMEVVVVEVVVIVVVDAEEEMEVASPVEELSTSPSPMVDQRSGEILIYFQFPFSLF